MAAVDDPTHPPSTLPPTVATSPKQDIEEGNDAYRLGGFHPVYIGDVYKNRYKVLNKIGYGIYSTVWLVEDMEKEQVHTLFALLVYTNTNEKGRRCMSISCS